jgi:hypothetical protein
MGTWTCSACAQHPTPSELKRALKLEAQMLHELGAMEQSLMMGQADLQNTLAAVWRTQAHAAAQFPPAHYMHTYVCELVASISISLAEDLANGPMRTRDASKIRWLRLESARQLCRKVDWYEQNRAQLRSHTERRRPEQPLSAQQASTDIAACEQDQASTDTAACEQDQVYSKALPAGVTESAASSGLASSSTAGVAERQTAPSKTRCNKEGRSLQSESAGAAASREATGAPPAKGGAVGKQSSQSACAAVLDSWRRGDTGLQPNGTCVTTAFHAGMNFLWGGCKASAVLVFRRYYAVLQRFLARYDEDLALINRLLQA